MIARYAIALLALLAQPARARPNESLDPRLEALIALERANLDSFRYFASTFDLTEGEAPSCEAARAGNFTSGHTAAGRYATDGRNYAYDRVHDDAALLATARAIGELQVSGTLFSFRRLTDGEVTLREHINAFPQQNQVIRSTLIVPGSAEFFHELWFPLGVGKPQGGGFEIAGLGRELQSGTMTITSLDEAATYEEAPCVHLIAESETGKSEWWIDPARGAIALRVLSTSGRSGRVLDLRNDDLRQVEGAGWLPFRVTLYADPPGLVQANRLIITSFDARQPPDRSVFRMEFPEPIGVTDAAHQLHYPRQKVWSLLDLPAADQAGVVRAIMEGGAPPPELPGARSVGSKWQWVLVALGALFALAALYRVARIRIART